MTRYILRIVVKVVLVELVAKTTRSCIRWITKKRGPRKLTQVEEMAVLAKYGFIDEEGYIIEVIH